MRKPKSILIDQRLMPKSNRYSAVNQRNILYLKQEIEETVKETAGDSTTQIVSERTLPASQIVKESFNITYDQIVANVDNATAVSTIADVITGLGSNDAFLVMASFQIITPFDGAAVSSGGGLEIRVIAQDQSRNISKDMPLFRADNYDNNNLEIINMENLGDQHELDAVKFTFEGKSTSTWRTDPSVIVNDLTQGEVKINLFYYHF